MGTLVRLVEGVGQLPAVGEDERMLDAEDSEHIDHRQPGGLSLGTTLADNNQQMIEGRFVLGPGRQGLGELDPFGGIVGIGFEFFGQSCYVGVPVVGQSGGGPQPIHFLGGAQRSEHI